MEERDLKLLVEEEPEDALLTQIALKQAGLSGPVHVVTTGAEAMSYLGGQGRFHDRRAYALPTLIILALRLPLLHGFNLLRWIRARPQFKHIRIAILSGMEFPNEARVARELGADFYAVKPSEFGELVSIVRHFRGACSRPGNAPAVFGQAA